MENKYISLEEVTKRLGGNCHVQHHSILELDVMVIPHFGHCVSLNLCCDGVSPIPLYNSTNSIGKIIQCFMQLFNLCEDGTGLQDLIGRRIRVVYNDENKFNGRAVAVGSPLMDRFIFVEDLMNIGGNEND